MKAWTIVGWTYDAAMHCTECTEMRYPVLADDDEAEVEDGEGNLVHPIFASDEGWEGEACNDCGGELGQ